MAKRVPKYCHHKPTNQAYVRIDGRFHYLGTYDSQSSHKEFDRIMAKFHSGRFDSDSESITVNRLVVLYLDHAQVYYQKNGQPTSEVHAIRSAMKPLVKACGSLKVSRFGPPQLIKVREMMIENGWVRTTVNANVKRIKAMLKWAVVQGRIEASVWDHCKAVDGLKKDRTNAKESEPVRPVEKAVVEATKPFLSAELQTMIELQLLTGMRPGEVCAMRLADIDTSEDVWVYRPLSHKTQHRGKERAIPIGPKAQLLLKPYMNREKAVFLFSPAESEAKRNATRKADRQSPMTPSQASRTRKEQPLVTAGDHYRRDSYTKAIARACKLAKVDHWSPNQLRHTYATEVTRLFTLDAARTVLGHSEANTTLIYAERDLSQACRVAATIG